MIITKHGNKMNHGKCSNCNCEFLYSQKDDIHYYYNRINAYESELLYTYVNCPECNFIVKLD